MFYLPADVFDNPDFMRGMKMFMSPDGKAVRMIITHQGDPASVEGIEHVRDLKGVVADALKGTPLSNAKVSLAGTASLYADMLDGVTTDLLIVVIASMFLIFAIMLVITRSVVVALVIVGNVAASLGTACGLSVLLWQDILGLGVRWIVIPLSIVILPAVGSDYNLLVASRHGGDPTHRHGRRGTHPASRHLVGLAWSGAELSLRGRRTAPGDPCYTLGVEARAERRWRGDLLYRSLDGDLGTSGTRTVADSRRDPRA